MRVNNGIFKRLLVLAACVALMLQAAGADAVWQQSKQLDSNELTPRARRIVGYDGQITKLQVERPNGESTIKLVNKTASLMDVDFVATDNDGNEVGRETVVVEPNRKIEISFQSLFPELAFSDLSVIEVQSSVRPTENEEFVVQGQSENVERLPVD